MKPKFTIPLFPLGVVLMPHAALPLHIFEERYKTMIGECLESNKAFGVVFFDGKHISNVGCTAQIVEVLKVYENGEMDILTIGKKRFLISRIIDEKPYLEAEGVDYDDMPEADEEALARLSTQGLEFLESLAQMTGQEMKDEEMEALDPEQISFMISGSEGFSPSEKQRLLEMTSAKSRLESGVKALQKVIERMKISKEIQTIIGGNGNVKKMLMQIDGDQ
jgi:Lon protease-like protein